MSPAEQTGAIAAAITLTGLAAVTIRVWIGRAGETLTALLADHRDRRVEDLPPDLTDGTTWDPAWDEEPRPGSGPRREEAEL